MCSDGDVHYQYNWGCLVMVRHIICITLGVCPLFYCTPSNLQIMGLNFTAHLQMHWHCVSFVLHTFAITALSQLYCIVGSTDQESSQQLRTWFSEHFFAPKLVAWFVTRIVSVTALQIWREKMSKKPRSIRLLLWFDFSQSEYRKNNRKTFEGASVEPTAYTVYAGWTS